MGGKGELVELHKDIQERGRFRRRTRTTLKQQICDIIQRATFSITIQAMVQIPIHSLVDRILALAEEEIKRKKK